MKFRVGQIVKYNAHESMAGSSSGKSGPGYFSGNDQFLKNQKVQILFVNVNSSGCVRGKFLEGPKRGVTGTFTPQSLTLGGRQSFIISKAINEPDESSD